MEDPSWALKALFWPTFPLAHAGPKIATDRDPQHTAEGPFASPIGAADRCAPAAATPSAGLVTPRSELSMPSPPIATARLAPSRQGARSKSGISAQRPCFTVSCDDWTFHTLEFFFSGRQPADILREIKASPLHPEVHSR